MARLETALMLSIAYAASIGGFTTLVGTATNVAFQKAWRAAFPGAPELAAGEWMAMFLPLGVVFLLTAWQILTFRMPALPGIEYAGRAVFRRQLAALEPAGPAECAMGAIFAAAAVLWFFRVPLRIASGFQVPGWGPAAARMLESFGADPKFAAAALHDSTVAMTLSLLMFCVPAGRTADGRVQYLMDWQTARTLPWDVVLLLGGGFAIAEAFAVTRLSTWTGNVLARSVEGWHPWLVVVAVSILMTCLTEFTTNVATLYAVMPVLAATTVRLGIDPRLTLLPAAISTSCAFMLPAGTPPNAIVMGSGKVSIRQMCWYGLWLNIAGVVLVTLTAYFLVAPILGIDIESMPEWAKPSDAAGASSP
jgi:sodium-dependent dicarboxylate transporter 2/3/5